MAQQKLRTRLKSLAFLWLIGLFTIGSALAQNAANLKGLVQTESNEPLNGVSVSATNVATKKTISTTTDEKGMFSMTTLEIGSTYNFTFSFVGYQNGAVNAFKIKEGNENTLLVRLKLSNNNLNDVVVVGYGTQGKRDISTSVASLKSSDINNFPATGLDKALTGKLAGVQVIQPGGAPGAGIEILVRGRGTITAGSDPLYVIDGVPLSDKSIDGPGFKVNPLNAINMNDIESIDILKDASAAAIYGSRGANGVVIITTKKGKVDKPIISYNGYVGIQEVNKKISMMNAYEYAELIYDARNASYFDLLADRGLNGSVNDDNVVRRQKLGAAPSNNNLNYILPPEIFPYLNKQEGLTSTDWQNEIFRKALMQNHTISVAGGSESIKYYISTNYLSQEGVVINSGYKKYGGRINIDANYQKLKIGARINYNYGIYNFLPSEGRFNDASENVISGALAAAPFFPVYNPDGGYNFDQANWTYAQANNTNPVALAMLRNDETIETKMLSNIFAEYAIRKDLRYKLSFGVDISNYDRNAFRPSTLPNYTTKAIPSNPIGNYRTNGITNWLVENTLNYTKQSGKHTINAVVGLATQKEKQNASNISATGFSNNVVQTLNGATTITAFSSTINEWSLISGFSRVQYSYNKKYYVSAAIRADGSSRFGNENKWGYFPSASAAWIISDENFMKNINTISTLKLRTSYGLTGNFQIGNYAQYGLLAPANYILGAGSGTLNNGLALSTASNKELGWEKMSAINIGLDLGLFNEKLSATVDIYSNNTKDLLLNVPVPLITGFSSNLVNIGKVNNKGIELGLHTNFQIGAFTIMSSANFSKNINKVIDMGGADAIITRAQGVVDFITQVGKPIASFYTLVQTGIFQNESDISNPKNAKVPGAKPGDFMYKDVNGDGIIDNTNDREITGNYMPDFIYGFSNQVIYKMFDLSFAIQGIHGNTIANINQRHINIAEGFANNTTEILGRWKSEADPGNGRIPRANRAHRGLNAVTSTFHLSDGSYMRIRDITLGFTLPKSLLSKIRISNSRFFITAQNPFTFTKYNSYNPEVSIDSNPLTPGVDYGSYPLARAIFFGANISF